MFKRVFPFFFLIACISCSQNNNSGEKQQPGTLKTMWEPPAAGTTVAEYKERVTEDNLNEKYFRVTVKTTDLSPEGAYLLKLEYGYNINETDIRLPEWNKGTILKPVLKKGDGAYHCLLGFDAGDGRFRELYLINAEGGNIRLKQTKGYYKSSR